MPRRGNIGPPPAESIVVPPKALPAENYLGSPPCVNEEEQFTMKSSPWEVLAGPTDVLDFLSDNRAAKGRPGAVATSD